MSDQHIIDVDRGVTIRQVVKFDKVNPSKFNPDPQYGGLTVYMYVDAPGVYYDVHGRVVPEGLAEMAGFEIKALAKQRHKREALEAFNKKLTAEFATEVGDEEEIIAEDGDWKVVALPMQRAKIVDKSSGEAITAVPMPRADALVLLAHLTGTADGIKVSREAAKAVQPDKKDK